MQAFNLSIKAYSTYNVVNVLGITIKHIIILPSASFLKKAFRKRVEGSCPLRANKKMGRGKYYYPNGKRYE